MNAFVKRLLTVLGALFLLVYAGYQGYQALYSPIRTETVVEHSLYETVDTTGFTIRNETLIPLDTTGHLFYTVANGSRVAKGGDIAEVYPTESDALSQQKLDSLDAEIALLQSIQEQGKNSRVNLDLINKQLSQAVDALVLDAHDASLTQLPTLRTELLSLLNKQQIITGKVQNFSERIAALQQERSALASSFQKSTGSVKSPVAGYFVSSADGYENAVEFDKVTDLTPDDLNALLESQPKAGTEAYMGKVVADYEWYFACNVPDTYISMLSEGASLSIRLPFVSESEIPVKVAACNRDRNGRIAVIFRCESMSEELSSIRIEQVQILLVKHTGLRVPKEAIVTNDAYETGVYVRVGNMVAFRKIEQEYNEAATYSICKEIDEDGYLKLYDDVILGGKGLYDGKIIR